MNPEKSAPVIKIKLQLVVGDTIAIGPGKAQLLEAIETTGSIAAAGRSLGISYRRTRDMIDAMNQPFGGPLMETTKGGAHGGGSCLTAKGREVLAAYRKLEQAVANASDQHSVRLLDAVEMPLAEG